MHAELLEIREEGKGGEGVCTAKGKLVLEDASHSQGMGAASA